MTHVVVVGSGVAGLTAALHASERGISVTVLTKNKRDESATQYAQGGIAAVVFPDDTIAAHIDDTLRAGHHHNDREAVRVLASEGPQRIREMINRGVAFDHSTDGDLLRGREGAHSSARILHAGGDAPGAAVERALLAAIDESEARVFEDVFVSDLITEDARVYGVEIITETGRETITADAVILATGGAGHLYPHTTNPSVSTGDGLAIALRAGAAVADLEFVQFHPTVLGGPDAFLISEAVRGEGAVLRNPDGERFCVAIHSDAELAPRDVVSQAITEQMDQYPGRAVVLDATEVGRPHTARFLQERFPQIDTAVRVRGYDWSVEPIPVTPAAHYLMGGIHTDLWGRSSIAGLYAVGEVAHTGVHGANRLASNSLLEGAVFGTRVAQAVEEDLDIDHQNNIPEPAYQRIPPEDTPDARHGFSSRPFSRSALQELMWAHVGVRRDHHGLTETLAQLTQWSGQGRTLHTISDHEDNNLLTVAVAVTRAALARTHSLGAHLRSDDQKVATAC